MHNNIIYLECMKSICVIPNLDNKFYIFCSAGVLVVLTLGWFHVYIKLWSTLHCLLVVPSHLTDSMCTTMSNTIVCWWLCHTWLTSHTDVTTTSVWQQNTLIDFPRVHIYELYNINATSKAIWVFNTEKQ